ncbi:MAG: hypothetical protein E2600_06885 [Chryseobacterium sp.]|nr:hypothetical protein [Chryseobacterium sp.]
MTDVPDLVIFLQTEVFTVFDGNTITGLSLQVSDGTLSSKKLLGITKDKNDKITTLINDNLLNNPKFLFKNELHDEESDYTSSEGTQYRKYSLCVIGEDQDGELKFYEPTDKVFVITIYRMVFASEVYVANSSPDPFTTMRLLVDANPTTSTERITILQNGNVRIGTNTPISGLHLKSFENRKQ